MLGKLSRAKIFELYLPLSSDEKLKIIMERGRRRQGIRSICNQNHHCECSPNFLVCRIFTSPARILVSELIKNFLFDQRGQFFLNLKNRQILIKQLKNNTCGCGLFII